MKADRQSRMWPYVGLLLCLFALSVTAPRAWQRAALRYRQGNGSQGPAVEAEQLRARYAGPGQYEDPTQAEEAATPPKASPRDQGVKSDTPRMSVRVSNSDERLAMRVPHTIESPGPSGPVLLPQAESESAGLEEAKDPTALSEATDHPTLVDPADSPDIAAGETSTSDVPPSAEEPEPTALAESGPDDAEISSVDNAGVEAQEPATDSLATDEPSPADDVPAENAQPEDASSPADPDQTSSLAWATPQLLLEQVAVLTQIPAAANWAASTQALIERLSAKPLPERDLRAQLLTELQAARRQIEQMADAEQQWETKAGLLRAQYALSRRLDIWQAIHELGTTPPTQEVSDEPGNPTLQWREVELCRLLDQLEQFEAGRLPHLARSISEQRRSLIHSTSLAEQSVGKRIEQNYRNANVRLAISEDFMNRFLPKPQVFDAPVDDTIMGASVSGHSRTLNELRLRLIPDERKIRLGLEAHGVVHSNTNASTGTVTIYNQGHTTYVGRKLVLISSTGLHVWPAVAEAHAASNTQGIETGYDSIPLVRSIIRNMAQTQQDESYGQAMAEVEARVEDTVSRRLDKEANPRITKLSREYVEELQGPLERLQLAPTPISLSTTEDRAIIRFRVAGDTQLGAHTPRPCAPSDSVASVQVHESVLNNVADQLGLNGQTFALPELYRMVADKLSLTISVPDDLPEDAQVTFADKDAVLIRCDDGKISVTLSIAELSAGRRSFRNFRATAAYHLLSHGLHTELERDGVVQLAGRRLSFGEQIALRGVISKMFSQNHRPQIIPEEQAADSRLTGLRVTQLVVVDGWIGLAIAPDQLARGNSKAGTSVNR